MFQVNSPILSTASTVRTSNLLFIYISFRGKIFLAYSVVNLGSHKHEDLRDCVLRLHCIEVHADTSLLLLIFSSLLAKPFRVSMSPAQCIFSGIVV